MKKVKKPLKTYSLYCLLFVDGTIYYGISENVERRRRQHLKKWEVAFEMIVLEREITKKSVALIKEAHLITTQFLSDPLKLRNKCISRFGWR